MTQAELVKLYDKANQKQWDDKKFAAAIKGIDLDENMSSKSKFEEVQRRAHAKAMGMNEEAFELDGYFNIVDE